MNCSVNTEAYSLEIAHPKTNCRLLLEKKHVLGQGSFSLCHLFEISPKTGFVPSTRKFAVTSFSKKLKESTKFFNNHICIHKKLLHPNVVKLVDWQEDSDHYYLIQEHCEQSLCSLLQERGRLPEEEVAEILLQLVDGASYLHKKKIMHRNLKLENIYLNNGEVKIGDFKFSRKLNFSRSKVTKRMKEGSPNYFSPEIINNEPHSTEADVWSLGVIAYELLTGHHPFTQPSSQKMYQSILKADVKFPRVRPMSDGAEDLVKRMLHVNRKKRITLKEVLKHPFMQAAVPQPPAENDSAGTEKKL